jgi:hypothetical protein
MINYVEFLHIINDIPHNASILFLAPLNILTLLPRIRLNLGERLINLKELLHFLHDLPHNASNLFLAPLNILTLLPLILLNH